MARLPRISLPFYPHHIIQRGNNRQAIFSKSIDYSIYLDCLGLAKEKARCRIFAYVLMTNHVHLLVEPSDDSGLGVLLQSVGRRYVRYFNQRYKRTGTLWEGRYKSAVVSRDEYLMVCGRYIEMNPVRAGMVGSPKEYPWSSYRFRAFGKPDQLLDEDPWYQGLGSIPEERQRAYRSWVSASFSRGEWDQIRDATQKGRVIGSTRFQNHVESMLGRRLTRPFSGRPRKAGSNSLENVL